MQSASQVPSATRLKVFKRLFGKSIELASLDVTLDRLIKTFRLELLKPSAKPLKLLDRQLSDRFFDVFECCHGRYASGFASWPNVCLLRD